MAESVWFLRHRRISKLPNVRRDRESIITLGFYKSRQAALADIDSHRDLEGFVDYPDGWDIVALPLNDLLENPVEI